MPPKGKRKRSASPAGAVAAPAPVAGTPTAPKKSRFNDGLASDAATKVEVVYELVGSDKTCTRDMTDKTLDEVALGVTQDLNIPVLGLRFTHVRSTGVETDVWDDFDFRAIRARAVAQGSHTEVIRVYSGALGQTPEQGRAASFSPGTALGHDPRVTESAPATVAHFGSGSGLTPRSALRSPGDGTPRSQKRVVLALPSDTPPSTPSPDPQAPNPRRERKRRKRSSVLSPPRVTPPASLTRIESLAAKHKPARPSPLAKSTAAAAADPKGKGKAIAPAPRRSKLNPAPRPGDFPPVVGTLPPPVSTAQEGESSTSQNNAPGPSSTGYSSDTSSSPLADDQPPGPFKPSPWLGFIELARFDLEQQKANASAAEQSAASEPTASTSGSGESATPTASTSTGPASASTPTSAAKKAPAKRGPKPKAKAADPEAAGAPPPSDSPAAVPAVATATEPTTVPATVPATTPATVPPAEPATVPAEPAEAPKTRAKPGPKPKPKAASDAPKRPPGRPRKVAESAAETAGSAADASDAPSAPAKRGPGRPKKVVEPAPNAVAGPSKPAPKKRGRPSKAKSADEADEPKAPAKRLGLPPKAKPADTTDTEAPKAPAKRGPKGKGKAKAEAEAVEADVSSEESSDDEAGNESSGESEDDESDKEPEPAPQPVKRPPGRPRKSVPAESAAETPVKRGPGRPKKVSQAAAEPAAEAPKRKGRPPKKAAEAPTEEVPAAAAATAANVPEEAVPADPPADIPVVQPTAVEEASDEAMEVDDLAPVANGHAADDVEMEDAADDAASVKSPNEDGAADLDTPPVNERGTTEALAEPEGCLLCGQAADHSPKDCTVVVGGVERVRERLEMRRQELIEAGWRKPAIKTDGTVEMCQQWITRLTKVAAMVVNGTPQKSSPVKPVPAEATPKPAPVKATPISTPAKAGVTPKPLTVAQRFAASNGVKTPVTPATPKNDSDGDSSDDDATPSAPTPGTPGTPGTPDTPSYPLSLHLMAAARAARRPGSSRLSVSDAVIETGDSSDSDSSSSGSGSEAESIDSDADDSDSESGSGSDSDSDSSPGNIDSEALLRQIMTKPLSQRQRAEAARSAAAMHVVSQEDITEASDATDSEDEIMASRPTQRRGSESSIGDFGEGEAEDGSAHLDEEDSEAENKNRLLHHVVAASQAEKSVVPAVPEAMEVDEESEEEHYSEDEVPAETYTTPRRPASPPSFSSTRSFSRLAATSPALGDLPGDIALREAIQEDVAPFLDGVPESGDLAATQVVDMRVPPSLSPPPSPGKSQTRDSSLTPAPESDEDEKPKSPQSPSPSPPKRRGRPPKNAAAPPASQPVRRSARVLSHEPDAPASQPVRVTRSSSSRDESPQRATRSSTGALPALPTRVTRSSSKLSSSPHDKMARAIEDESNADETTPRPKTRGFPSSLALPPNPTPSPSRSPSPTSSIDASQSIPVPDPETPIPATQSSPLLRRTRGNLDTPLFMTQPSQMPATQAYHSIPPPLVPETQENGHAGEGSGGHSDARSDAGSEHSAYSERSGSAHSSHSHSSVNSDGYHSDHSSDSVGFPALPTLRPSSQPAPIASSFPTLSSLPKDLLRQGVDGVQSMWNRVTGPKEEEADESSSSESSDSSDEEDAVDDNIRARYAGRERSAKKPRTRGIITTGW